MQQKSELPEGWNECKVKDIAVINYGKGLKKSDRIEGKFDVFGSNGVIGKHNQSITSGPTIIIGRKGSVGEVNLSSGPCWPIDTTYYIDNFDEINRTFLYFLLKTLNLANYDTSTAIPGINRNDIYSLIINLPHRPEQQRIVEAIDTLFTRLDATDERLNRMPEILGTFRKAVLNKAFEGELTKEWRIEQASLTNIEELLEHIFIEQNNYSKASGKKVKNIKKLTDAEIEVLSQLPDEWRWERLGRLVNEIVVGYVGPITQFLTDDNENGTRLLSTTHIGEKKFLDNKEIRYVNDDFSDKNKKSEVTAGDIIIARHGDSGKCCIIPSYIKRAQVSNAVIVRPNSMFMSSYILYSFDHLRKNLQESKVGGVQQIVNTKTMETFPFPICSLPEQKEIVRRVDALFAFADSIEAKVAAVREKTEQLRQSILAKAFSGELVPTEAELARQKGRDNESAEVLLEKIKTERASSKKNKK